MIPRIIHYCWFGHNPLPEFAQKCIESWKKYLPEYEIKEWNEDNFDVNIIQYTSEAYKEKKYAFVSDYARYWILYKYGGLYFDTDVEVIKPMDDIVGKGPFMGCEHRAGRGRGIRVAPGLALGASKHMKIYEELIEMYSALHFVNEDGSYNQLNIVDRTTNLLREHGLEDIDNIQKVAEMTIYPVDYFCPMNRFTLKTSITERTVSIHHYDASWQTPETKWIQRTSYKYSWIPKMGYIVKFIGALRYRGFCAAVNEFYLWFRK